ncbi:hypothetical protein B9T33_07845 [Acinetobacter sp. ANC 5054]|nr:hypothetical protein B9T33_07845 [Acinetobacter sp. ANC 5054]
MFKIMVKPIKPLTFNPIYSAQTKDKDYTLCDGEELYLRIRKLGSKTLIFEYKNVQCSRVVLIIGYYLQ